MCKRRVVAKFTKITLVYRTSRQGEREKKRDWYGSQTVGRFIIILLKF